MTINCRLDADCRQLELAKRELELKIDLIGDDDEGNEATEDRQEMVSLLCDDLSESNCLNHFPKQWKAYIVGFFSPPCRLFTNTWTSYIMFYMKILLLKLLWIGLFQGYKASEEILKKDRFDSYITIIKLFNYRRYSS